MFQPLSSARRKTLFTFALRQLKLFLIFMKTKYLLLCFVATGLFTQTYSANAETESKNRNNYLENKIQNIKNYQHNEAKNLFSEYNIPSLKINNQKQKPNQEENISEILLKELTLKPEDINNSELIKSAFTKTNSHLEKKCRDVKFYVCTKVVAVINDREENEGFFFGFGTMQPPTALQGSARPVTVDPSSNKGRGFTPLVRAGFTNSGAKKQVFTLAVEGGAKNLGFDMDYRKFTGDDRGYAANFFNRRSRESEFDGGERDVDLANGDNPWVHRIGGGVEFFRPLGKDFKGALGISYQLVSVRDGVFSDNLNNADELGNNLTFSDDGQDTLLTVNLAAALDRRNRAINPTKGYRLLLQTDQSIPIGDASLFFNRLSANYTHYIPLSLFRFTEGDSTLVLNLQGGTIIGDTPAYEAFSLGGSKSVRGYGRGKLGTGKSFVQASAEYRFPMFSFDAFKEEFDIGGTLFIDYGSDLGTADDVSGIPAIARDKPGDGFGYGFGLRALTPVVVLKLEFGLNDDGDSLVTFAIGDRF